MSGGLRGKEFFVRDINSKNFYFLVIYGSTMADENVEASTEPREVVAYSVGCLQCDCDPDDETDPDRTLLCSEKEYCDCKYPVLKTATALARRAKLFHRYYIGEYSIYGYLP